ncbi:MAG: thioredoxin, partial [Fusobacteriaceae bacterium]
MFRNIRNKRRKIMGKINNLNLDNFEAEVIKSQELVVVDFWAEWCGPCKMLGPILEEIVSETEYKICKVDVDRNSELSSQYKIRSIPTILIFKNGEKI